MPDNVIAAYKDIVAGLVAGDGPFAIGGVEARGRHVRAFTHAARNLGRIFTEIEAAYAARCFCHEEGRETSYAELFGRARRLAAALQTQFSIKRGEPVGIAAANRSEWLVAFVAIIWAGGVAALFNSRGTADELAAAAETAGTRLVIADGRRAALLGGAGVRLIAFEDVPAGAADYETLLQAEPLAAVEDPAPEEPAAILFTSGTTGRPKGAVLSHRNLANMVENLKLLNLAGVHLAARAYNVAPEMLLQMLPPVSTLLVFPLFHISGVTATLVTALSGGMITMMRRWRAELALPVIAANRVTMLSGPPLILADLLAQEEAPAHMGTLLNVAVGGQAAPESLMALVSRLLPTAAQSGGWGATETSGSVSSAAGVLFAAKPSSCGLLSPVMELRVVDDAGRDVAPGESGEFLLRGPLVMSGYWHAPEATAAAFDDEWYRTGDVGFVDEDGAIFLNDRKKDMVISGGENIYCAEIERVLSADEAFVEISMFGIPDERLGERAIVAVTLRDGALRTEDEVKAFIRAVVADYKVPSAVVFDLGPFPRNVTGKVNKALLRQTYFEKFVESV